MSFPVCNAFSAIELLATLCFRDGFLENVNADKAFETVGEGLVLCHVLREDE